MRAWANPAITLLINTNVFEATSAHSGLYLGCVALCCLICNPHVGHYNGGGRDGASERASERGREGGRERGSEGGRGPLAVACQCSEVSGRAENLRQADQGRGLVKVRAGGTSGSGMSEWIQ